MSANKENRLEQVLNTITQSNLEALKPHQQQHVEILRDILAQKNVVGIGISEKVSKGENLGKLAITFYVEKKLPLKKLSGHEVIPPTVPEAVSGATAVPTDVIQLGRIKLQDRPPFIQKQPIQPGNSVGHVKCTAGTLGAIVTRGRKRFILSNSHVLALSGKAKIGDPILYPGRADKGKVPNDIIAKLTKDIKFVTGGQFVNEVDCAIAEIHPPDVRPINSCMRGAKAPNGTTVAKRGMKVQISGRSSGDSYGEVKDTHFRFAIDYPGLGSVGFKNQVLCTRYSQDGDSGSLVVERRSGKAIGLHFAGASAGSVSSPIEAVLKKLSVSLDLAPRRTVSNSRKVRKARSR